MGTYSVKPIESCFNVCQILSKNKSTMMAGNPVIEKVGIVDVVFGERVRLVEPVNLYNCRIGDNSFIGPFVEIQKGAVIGANCKVQSHSFICELVVIGDHCFIGHGVVFINDLFTSGMPAEG